MRLLAVLVTLAFGVASAEKVVCYFGSWATWRPGYGKFDVEDIDPFLCTHVIFGFAGLSNHTWTIEVLDPWNELCPGDNGGNNCAYDRFVALKNKNPDLKVILAVGGWNEGSVDYSVMSADPVKRKTFVDSTIALIQKHRFDGLDMDWEYPVARGGAPEDKQNFITLLSDLKNRFNQFNPPLMLTGAVHCCKPTVDIAYDTPIMYELFDQVHIMSYDMHGAWEDFTHHNAPLCNHPNDTGDSVYFSVVKSINYHLSLGAPKDKLVLGIAVYGRCFTLDDINQNGMFAPASQPGPPGPYIRIPGTLGFNEICDRYMSDDCTISQDPYMNEPYFYCKSDNIWCGYDNAESVEKKARYAKNMGLSGILVWTIDTDDFKPRCYEEDFHLLRTMKRAVNAPADGKLPDCQTALSTTPGPITTTTTQESTPAPTTTPKPTLAPTTTPKPTPAPTTTPKPTPAPTTTPKPTPTPTMTPKPTHSPTTTPKPTPAPTTTPKPTPAPTTTPKPTPAPTTTPKPTPAPTTTPKPTPAPTTTPSSGGGGSSTPKPVHPRPNCNQQVDGSVYPHEDCNKYWVCVNGQSILEQCSPGTLFDETLSICNWEVNVETSHCNMWICGVDNIYYPHADCDKYYRCYNGSPHIEQCKDGLYWNQNITSCDNPINVDTSQCNAVLQ